MEPQFFEEVVERRVATTVEEEVVEQREVLRVEEGVEVRAVPITRLEEYEEMVEEEEEYVVLEQQTRMVTRIKWVPQEVTEEIVEMVPVTKTRTVLRPKTMIREVPSVAHVQVPTSRVVSTSVPTTRTVTRVVPATRKQVQKYELVPFPVGQPRDLHQSQQPELQTQYAPSSSIRQQPSASATNTRHQSGVGYGTSTLQTTHSTTRTTTHSTPRTTPRTTPLRSSASVHSPIRTSPAFPKYPTASTSVPTAYTASSSSSPPPSRTRSPTRSPWFASRKDELFAKLQ